MKPVSNISCPVSVERVNENLARVCALFTVLLTLLALGFESPYIALFLAFDFAIRAFTSGNISVVRMASRQVGQWFAIPEKLTDAAPKKFAAGLGMAFSIGIGLFQLTGVPLAAEITGALLIGCAILEGVFGICLGCIIYTWVVLPFMRNQP